MKNSNQPPRGNELQMCDRACFEPVFFLAHLQVGNGSTGFTSIPALNLPKGVIPRIYLFQGAAWSMS